MTPTPANRITPWRVAGVCMMAAIVASAAMFQAQLGTEATPGLTELNPRLGEVVDLAKRAQRQELSAGEFAQRLAQDFPEVVVAAGLTGAVLLTGAIASLVLLLLLGTGHRLKPRADWAPGPPWSLFDVVELALFVPFAILLAGLAVAGLRGGVQPSPGERILTAAISYVVVAGLTLALLALRTPGGWEGLRHVLRLVRGRVPRLVGAGALGYAVGLFAVFLTSLLPGLRQDPMANPLLPEIAAAADVWAKAVALVLVGIAAPLFEETVFRGVLYRTLRARWGVLVGVLLSAAVFAAVHMVPGQFAYVAVLGAAFAVLYEVTGSLLPAMVAHGLENTVSVIVLWKLVS